MSWSRNVFDSLQGLYVAWIPTTFLASVIFFLTKGERHKCYVDRLSTNHVKTKSCDTSRCTCIYVGAWSMTASSRVNMFNNVGGVFRFLTRAASSTCLLFPFFLLQTGPFVALFQQCLSYSHYSVKAIMDCLDNSGTLNPCYGWSCAVPPDFQLASLLLPWAKLCHFRWMTMSL